MEIGKNVLVVLFEVKADDDHLGVTTIYRLGEDESTRVGEVVTLFADDVRETVSKFDFGDELEERIVEVATETHFQIAVEAVVEQVPSPLHGEVEHRVHACHHVGTVVVEAFGRNLDVEGNGDISGFHVLVLPLVVQVVDESDFLRAEVHGGDDAGGDVVGESCLCQHTDAEARLVVGHVGKPLVAFLVRVAIVHQLDVLHVDASEKTVVKLALVDVGTVHHLARLGLSLLHEAWGNAPEHCQQHSSIYII